MSNTATVKPMVIAFNYTLKSNDGELIDASEPNQPLPFLTGMQQIIPGLESEIIKMSEGEKKKISVPAAQAYGEFRQDMMMDVPKEELAHLQGLDIGAHLQLQLGEGVKIVKVSKITDTHVTLDGNHPLAGTDLVFDVEVVLAREATADEIAHGHAHGLHGHSHH